ncbi:MAG: phosphatase PAP2 family protein [Candidatus Omnitrophica bacterium]|nr:phosphatase PAP2 family protein [Candidatus Omnitrophota bacterium]
MKKIWFTQFHPKPLVGLGVIACLLWEIRKGYFEKLTAFVKQLDWAPYGKMLFVFAAVSASFFVIDPRILHQVQSFQHPVLRILEQFGAWIGRGIHPWGILIGVYFLFEFLFRNQASSRKAFGAILSGGFVSLITYGMKYSFLRARPYGNEGSFSFFNLEGITQDARVYHSFPSGDTVVVAGISFFLWHQLKTHKGAWIFLLLPLMTAYSRMFLNRHWPSDTLMSLGIGWTFSLLIHEYHRYAFREEV